MLLLSWLRSISKDSLARRKLARLDAARPGAVLFEDLEPRCLLTTLNPVADSYDAVFGEALVTAAPATTGPQVTLVDAISTTKQFVQLEYSAATGLLFGRTSGNEITVIDTVSKAVIDQHAGTYGLTDMDLTPDGQFLFAADFGGELIGYGTPSNPSRVHRYDLANRRWEDQTVSGVAWHIEAVSATRFLAESSDQWITLTLYQFNPSQTDSTSLSSCGFNRPGDMEYDHRTGNVINGGNFALARVEGDQLTSLNIYYASDSGYVGMAISSDGRHYYKGTQQYSVADPTSLVRTFGEDIFAATADFAFGKQGFYSTNTGAYLGTLTDQMTVYFAGEDGQNVWAFNGTAGKLQHYRVGVLPAGVKANDGAPTGASAEVVTPPQHGTLTLQTNGQFRYSANAGFTGDDTFAYRLKQGSTTSPNATVTIHIPRPTARPAYAVADEYSVASGQTLSTTAGDIQFLGLQRRNSFTVGVATQQFEFSPQFNLLFARKNTTIDVYDGTTGRLIDTRVASTAFSDMDLTPDGRYLFAADYGGEATGYGTPLRQHYAVRYDLQTRTWEQRPTRIVWKIEAISTDRYIAQEHDQWVDAILNNFTTAAELSRSSVNYYGDIEFDPRTGRLYHGNSGLSSPEIDVLKVSGDSLSYVANTGGYGTAQYGGGSSVLSSDGRFFYYGALQVEAADVRHNLHTMPEIIRAASGLVAFGTNGYYDAQTGDELGRYGFSGAAPFVTDDGQQLWIRNGDQVVHYDLQQTIPGLFANDVGVSSPYYAARLVTAPEHGQLQLRTDGTFQYVPNADFVGDDTFSYRGRGVFGNSTIAAVTIHVAAITQVSHPDSYTAHAGQTISISSSLGLLANDTGFGPSTTTVELVSPPTKGTLQLQPNGSFTYFAGLTAQGDDQFSYRLKDGTIFSQPATVTLSLAPQSPLQVQLVNGELTVTPAASAFVRIVPNAEHTTAEVRIDNQLWTLAPNEVGLVTSVRVVGSSGNDRINLQAVTNTLFPNLSTVTIDGGGGTDKIFGSPLSDSIAPTALAFARITAINVPAGAQSVTYRVSFSEPVLEVDPSDFIVGGGSSATVSAVSSADQGEGLLYDVTIRGGNLTSFNGELSLNLASSSLNVTDFAGNPLVATEPAIDEPYQFDHVIPTVAITPNAGITNASVIDFNFALSEAVVGFNSADVVVTNGTKQAFRSTGSLTYGMQVVPTGDGVVTVTVLANRLRDAAANRNLATTVSVTSDRTRPTLAISPAFAFSNGDTITFTYLFSEAVSGFDAEDIEVTNATKGDFSIVNSSTYRLSVVPIADGAVTVNVAQRVAQDTAGNLSRAATGTVIADHVAPTVSIGSPSANEVDLGVITFPITFDDINFLSNSLTASDVVLHATGTATAAVQVSSSTGKTQLVTLSNFRGAGTIGISINAGVARDKAGNVSAASSTDSTVRIRTGIAVSRDQSGNLRIVDTKTENTADSLTVTIDISDSNYVIANPDSLVMTNIPGSVVIDEHTLSVPFQKVFGNDITIDSGLGGDTVRLKAVGRGSALTKNVLIQAGAGRDTVTLDGSLRTRFSGRLIVDGAGSDDVLSAAALVGSTFAVTLLGGPGNDTLTGGDANDVLDGGPDNDRLLGGLGNDRINGSGGNDDLFGEAGADELTGGDGFDAIDGGAGNDRLVETGDANFTLSDTQLIGLGTDQLTGLESATLNGGVSGNRIDAMLFSGSVLLRGLGGNDTLIGGAGADVLVGGDGNDELRGNDGNDFLMGDFGDDSLIGGVGTDILEGGRDSDSLDGGAEELDYIRHDELDSVLEDVFDILLAV